LGLFQITVVQIPASSPVTKESDMYFTQMKGKEANINNNEYDVLNEALKEKN
jgi:hypothetical protein